MGKKSVFAKGKPKPGGAKRKGGGAETPRRGQPGIYDSLNMPVTQWVTDGKIKGEPSNLDLPMCSAVWWWVQDGETLWVRKKWLRNNQGKNKDVKVGKGGDWVAIGIAKPAPFGYGDKALEELGLITLVEGKDGKPVAVDPETGKVLGKTELGGLRQLSFLHKAQELQSQLTDEMWVKDRAMYIRIARTATACESRSYARPRGKKVNAADMPRIVDSAAIQLALDTLAMKDLAEEWGEIANGPKWVYEHKAHLDNGTKTPDYKPSVAGQILPLAGSPREMQLKMEDALESKIAAKRAAKLAKEQRRLARRAAEQV